MCLWNSPLLYSILKHAKLNLHNSLIASTSRQDLPSLKINRGQPEPLMSINATSQPQSWSWLKSCKFFSTTRCFDCGVLEWKSENHKGQVKMLQATTHAHLNHAGVSSGALPCIPVGPKPWRVRKIAWSWCSAWSGSPFCCTNAHRHTFSRLRDGLPLSMRLMDWQQGKRERGKMLTTECWLCKWTC